MCNRVVVTPYGLNVISQLRQEHIHELRTKTPSPPLKSILKARMPDSPSVAFPSQRGVRSASVSFRGEKPNNFAKIQSKQQKLEMERMRIAKRIRQTMETSRELRQHCEISFLNFEYPDVSPEKTRARLLQNLKEEQDQKYAKAWAWLRNRGFYRAKALSNRPNLD